MNTVNEDIYIELKFVRDSILNKLLGILKQLYISVKITITTIGIDNLKPLDKYTLSLILNDVLKYNERLVESYPYDSYYNFQPIRGFLMDQLFCELLQVVNLDNERLDWINYKYKNNTYSA